MAFFDKQIKFKNFQAPSTSEYHLRLYKTADEDVMHMIELSDESNLKFIYRLRLTKKNLDKISDDNDFQPKLESRKFVEYIQEFVSKPENWLTCEMSSEKQCNIHFFEPHKLGEKRALKFFLLVVEGEELNRYFMDTAEKYKRRYSEKKRENEGQKKKFESYEKKIRTLEAEVEEKNKLRKELSDAKENIERLDFRYERLKADFERAKEELTQIAEEKERLEEDFDELEKEFDETEKEADELVILKDKAIEERDHWEEECKNLKNAIKHIAAKGKKYEGQIADFCQEIQTLRENLVGYEKTIKKLRTQNAEYQKESSLKDVMIQKLKNEVENLTIAVEMKDRIIEEKNQIQKLAVVASNENAQPSVKPRTRPCVFGNKTQPTLQLQKR